MRTLKKLWSIAEILALSLALEPTASPKPGNVHRYSDLPGLRYEDFLVTSIISVKYLYRGLLRGYRDKRYKVLFGDLIYYTLRETLRITNRSNTCLGSMLLLAPLAVSLGRMIRIEREVLLNRVKQYTTSILRESTVYDTVWFYRAVRLAKPKYIKRIDDTDEYVNVWDPRYKVKIIQRKQGFYETIKYSSSRDIVSRELYEGFPRSMNALRFLTNRLTVHGDWNRGVVETYLYLLSKHIDTTVLRIHGLETAVNVKNKARTVLNRVIDTNNYEWITIVEDFDKYLRSREINPGSIADIVVVTIALYLLENGKLP